MGIKWKKRTEGGRKRGGKGGREGGRETFPFYSFLVFRWSESLWALKSSSTHLFKAFLPSYLFIKSLKLNIMIIQSYTVEETIHTN